MTTIMSNEAGRAPLRPVYHFTPTANWINDPNGLVYYAGEYHLFFQYHPETMDWGPMHWGHAVSTDLFQWEELPIALSPDELGTIFSGSAVIDWQNTAGFGKEAMVAIYTYNAPEGQSQAIAYSIDKGRTWSKYVGNPVIESPSGEKDFRDPKVFWYAGNEDNTIGNDGGHWVMLLAVHDSIWFYTSPDLKRWTFVSEFGEMAGSHAGEWETPDLFALQIDDQLQTRWVLTVGIGFGASVKEQGTQYFVGDFDGNTFVNINAPETILRADYGPDFYAAQGWNDAPTGRKLWIGWMNNWAYARQIPAETWRGTMTLPRELCLGTTAEGLRLKQRSLPELKKRRSQSWRRQNQTIEPGDHLLAQITTPAVEVSAEFNLDLARAARRFGIRFWSGEDEQTTIGYDLPTEMLFVDRTQSGQTDFSADFADLYQAPLQPVENRIRLHIFIDHSSVEVFGNDGFSLVTAQIFPTNHHYKVDIFADDGKVMLTTFDMWQLL